MESAQILEAIYGRKLKTNPGYSRRAFARDMKCSPSFLTNFIKGRRHLSRARAEEIVALLKLDKKTGHRFVRATVMESLEASSPGRDVRDLLNETSTLEAKDIDQEVFQFFNSWYHLAVLDLVACKDFQASSVWIADRLGLKPEVAFATVDRLKRLGLVKIEGDRLVKTNAHIRMPSAHNGINIFANFHRQMIDKALKELDVTEPERKEKRLITGVTMSIPKTKIPLAKEKIEKFKREMAALLTAGDADEVVQLNIQFFPLTK